MQKINQTKNVIINKKSVMVIVAVALIFILIAPLVLSSDDNCVTVLPTTFSRLKVGAEYNFISYGNVVYSGKVEGSEGNEKYLFHVAGGPENANMLILTPTQVLAQVGKEIEQVIESEVVTKANVKVRWSETSILDDENILIELSDSKTGRIIGRVVINRYRDNEGLITGYISTEIYDRSTTGIDLRSLSAESRLYDIAFGIEPDLSDTLPSKGLFADVDSVVSDLNDYDKSLFERYVKKSLEEEYPRETIEELTEFDRQELYIRAAKNYPAGKLMIKQGYYPSRVETDSFGNYNIIWKKMFVSKGTNVQSETSIEGPLVTFSVDQNKVIRVLLGTDVQTVYDFKEVLIHEGYDIEFSEQELTLLKKIIIQNQERCKKTIMASPPLEEGLISRFFNKITGKNKGVVQLSSGASLADSLCNLRTIADLGDNEGVSPKPGPTIRGAARVVLKAYSTGDLGNPNFQNEGLESYASSAADAVALLKGNANVITLSDSEGIKGTLAVFESELSKYYQEKTGDNVLEVGRIAVRAVGKSLGPREMFKIFNAAGIAAEKKGAEKLIFQVSSRHSEQYLKMLGSVGEDVRANVKDITQEIERTANIKTREELLRDYSNKLTDTGLQEIEEMNEGSLFAIVYEDETRIKILSVTYLRVDVNLLIEYSERIIKGDQKAIVFHEELGNKPREVIIKNNLELMAAEEEKAGSLKRATIGELAVQGEKTTYEGEEAIKVGVMYDRLNGEIISFYNELIGDVPYYVADLLRENFYALAEVIMITGKELNEGKYRIAKIDFKEHELTLSEEVKGIISESQKQYNEQEGFAEEEKELVSEAETDVLSINDFSIMALGGTEKLASLSSSDSVKFYVSLYYYSTYGTEFEKRTIDEALIDISSAERTSLLEKAKKEYERKELEQVHKNLERENVLYGETIKKGWISPDGKKIVVGSTPTGTFDMFVHERLLVAAGYETEKEFDDLYLSLVCLLDKGWVRKANPLGYEIYGIDSKKLDIIEEDLLEDTNGDLKRGVNIDDAKAGKSYIFTLQDYMDNNFNLQKTIQKTKPREYYGEEFGALPKPLISPKTVNVVSENRVTATATEEGMIITIKTTNGDVDVLLGEEITTYEDFMGLLEEEGMTQTFNEEETEIINGAIKDHEEWCKTRMSKSPPTNSLFEKILITLGIKKETYLSPAACDTESLTSAKTIMEMRGGKPYIMDLQDGQAFSIEEIRDLASDPELREELRIRFLIDLLKLYSSSEDTLEKVYYKSFISELLEGYENLESYLEQYQIMFEAQQKEEEYMNPLRIEEADDKTFLKTQFVRFEIEKNTGWPEEGEVGFLPFDERRVNPARGPLFSIIPLTRLIKDKYLTKEGTLNPSWGWQQRQNYLRDKYGIDEAPRQRTLIIFVIEKGAELEGYGNYQNILITDKVPLIKVVKKK
ncbi:hypothetical protein COU61_04385 [Candidatus Pacearchaeota archaeon CG10_big_fil_rev_8_21_14_0_10_35_13]|nr:MAG: hypothetical protein COU61_04385 [Candidatus Pacearchaeota archaeon CG10_big_fil_rev_8_21_14_0_10_35_13]